MQLKNNLFSLIIILSLAVSCEKSPPASAEHSIDSNDKNDNILDSLFINAVKQSSSLSELFNPTNTIDLSSESGALIGEINSIRYLKAENKLLIVDSFLAQTVFLFDTDGTFIHKFGNIGDGPNEYKTPKCIAYENGILFVNGFDLKLLKYKLNGDLIDEIKLLNNRLNFSIDKMVLHKNNLYCYTNQPYRNFGCNNHQYRVFQLRDGQLKNCYGEPEETFHVWGGDITVFGERIIYSGVFNGKIYEISPGRDASRTLFELQLKNDLGLLNNLSDSKKLGLLIKNIHNYDFMRSLGVIRNLLFVQRNKFISVLDHEGRLLNDHIKDDLTLPKGYKDFAMPTTVFQFYEDGLILPSYDTKRFKQNKSPNPSLIFFGIRDSLKSDLEKN